jgi:hypothetical protein
MTMRMVVTVVAATAVLTACGSFLFSGDVRELELEKLYVRWVTTDSIIAVGDSLLVEVRVINGDGEDVTSLVKVSWRAGPTTICALSSGIELGPTARYVQGLAVGQAIVSVRARAARPNEEEVKSSVMTRTFIVEP